MIPNNKPYIIVETAFHHEGDKNFLKGLIKDAKEIGVNAVKFHLLLDIDDYMIADHDAIEVLKPWCLNSSDWDEIIEFCGDIDIILLCNDQKSIEYAIQKGNRIKAIEIHATGINDIFLLEKASKFNQTVILGTGGSSLDEIDFAIQFLKDNNKLDVFLMHGFQNYPTDYKDIKLSRMSRLNQLFNLPIGYADHTDPLDENNEFISCIPLANGFNVIEKHFTTNFGEKRIDAQAAVNVNQLKKIKELSQIIWSTLDLDSCLKLSPAEMKYGNTGPMKKAIVAKNDIQEGELITLSNIAFKRTNASSSSKQLDLSKLLNNKTTRFIKKDEIIDLNNIQFSFLVNDISQFKNTK